MEEKLFDMMSKMYGELSEFRNETKQGLITTDKGIKSLRGHMVLLENKVDTNSKALVDGYKQIYEKLGVIEGKVDNLSDKYFCH